MLNIVGSPTTVSQILVFGSPFSRLHGLTGKPSSERRLFCAVSLLAAVWRFVIPHPKPGLGIGPSHWIVADSVEPSPAGVYTSFSKPKKSSCLFEVIV